MDKIILELKNLEPYWNICFPCKNKGKCCVGADTSIYQSEWNIIVSYIEQFSEADKKILLSNILLNKPCFFHSDDKCLIHEVRPQNCRYTPFQYVITADNNLRYTMISPKCEFKSILFPLAPDMANKLRAAKFSKLPNFDTKTCYISLNYLLAKEKLISNTETSHPLSEWIHSLNMSLLV